MSNLVPENEQQYGSILTVLGENAEQNGKLLNKQVEFTHIAFGDANDTYVQPDRKAQSLVNELHRIPVNSVDVLQPTPDSVPILKVEAILPDDINDVVIREFASVATFNGQTYFHAMGNCARVYVPKPINNGNVSNPVTLEMTFVITSADPIVEIDPNVITASRDYVNKRVTDVDKIYTRNFKSISDLKAGIAADNKPVDFTEMIGHRVEWRGYYKESDGGSNWGIVKQGPHVDDGGSIFTLGVNLYVDANLKGELINIKKFGAIGDDVRDDTQNIQNAINYGKAVKAPEGSYKLSDKLNITVPFDLTPDASLVQTNSTSDTLHIYSSGAIFGGGKIDVSNIDYQASVLKFDTKFNGSYDWHVNSSSPMNSKCGADSITIITDSNVGKGTGLHLRAHDEQEGNSYISWLMFQNIRIIGRFLNGINLDRGEPGDNLTWINGNMFDNILIDKSIYKVVGADANTYNTFNNIITQPNGDDLVGNDATVYLDAGYTQGYYWDGDKVVLAGGHDDLQRIAPHSIFYGDEHYARINLTRGITNSPWFQRIGLDETLLGMKSLIANINGGSSGQVGRGMFKYDRLFGETWKTFSNSVDIEYSSENVNFYDDLGYTRHSYALGAFELPGQHLALGRGTGSGQSGDWGRIWCNKAGVINPRAPFQAHLLVSPHSNKGKYQIGLAAQDNSASKTISDGIYIEWDNTDGTENVTAVMWSGGVERARKSIPTTSFVTGNFLSIYIIGVVGEIKIAWQYGDSHSSPDLTTDYLDVFNRGNYDGARFNQAVLLGTQPAGLLAPFYQLENVNGGVPNLYLHSVECQGHRTVSTIKP
ncbi:phage tail-collar fiber domain-containing protein [Vibrio parahaemolyticus]